jgi:hypothetical protein
MSSEQQVLRVFLQNHTFLNPLTFQNPLVVDSN